MAPFVRFPLPYPHKNMPSFLASHTFRAHLHPSAYRNKSPPSNSATHVQLYKTTEGPRFIRGHAVTLAMVALASGIYAFMSAYFFSRNKRRADGKEDHRIQGLSEEEVKELGDDSPRFVFTY